MFHSLGLAFVSAYLPWPMTLSPLNIVRAQVTAINLIYEENLEELEVSVILTLLQSHCREASLYQLPWSKQD